jgi:hypothetical protein
VALVWDSVTCGYVEVKKAGSMDADVKNEGSIDELVIGDDSENSESMVVEGVKVVGLKLD